MIISAPPSPRIPAVLPQADGGASGRETISHVVRRLGIGSHARLVLDAASVDDAIGRALDLSEPPADPPEVPVPEDLESLRDPSALEEVLGFWISRMVRSRRLIEERLVWFWHDHFATSIRKVLAPYLMWVQHLTIRRHATGRFDELLRAIARDPAMLVYLDGRSNRAGRINENFAREVMELHTMGRGAYDQADVVAAARSFTGWVVTGPGDRFPGTEPWSATFVPRLHDAGSKTLLGRTGRFDMDGALDVILEQQATATHVAGKLFVELVGLNPDEGTVARLAAVFRRDYQILPLVEAIVGDPAFTSAEAIRIRVRNPIERLVGILQGFPSDARAGRIASEALRKLGFLPLAPPNPAGYPSGERLLGPFTLAHSISLSGVVAADAPAYPTDEIFVRLGLHDVSPESRRVVDGAEDPLHRITLAAASPEYTLT